MTDGRSPALGLRLLAAAVTSVLLVASAVAVSRVRTSPLAVGTEAPDAGASPSPGRSGEPSPGSSPEAAALPTDPAEAEALGGEELLAAGLAAARGPWSDLGHPAWEAAERPVYVAWASLTDDRRHVDADVTVAFRAERDLDELVLRLLPAAESLAHAPAVTVRRGGAEVTSTVDRDGARLLVPMDPPVAAGDAASVRVQLSYDLTDRRQVLDDGGPAGFGLLAWNASASVLGHWLPLLTTDDGPMIPWGDLGAFPAAVWSVVLETDATVVGGGREDPCPQDVGAEAGCVWIRGVALRDVSAVAYDRMVERSAPAGPFTLNAVSAPDLEPQLDAALDISLSSFRSYLRRFGPLAWTELDVAAAPLGAGAAGMEFPGLLVIDDEDNIYTSMGAGFGAFVVAHEVAHQWFHGLVGNGSLSSPVVDESLAQYLSYLAFADAYGAAAATGLADTSFAGRYLRARDAGVVDEPPAQPLEDFAGMDSYGSMVYARAPLAWVAAEERIGRDAVVGFLGDVVERWGLGSVSDDELLAFARERAPEIAAVLERFWFDPAPVDAR